MRSNNASSLGLAIVLFNNRINDSGRTQIEHRLDSRRNQQRLNLRHRRDHSPVRFHSGQHSLHLPVRLECS